MKDVLRILCVGTPVDLRLSRQLVLQSAGHTVVSVQTKAAIDTLSTGSFDVVLLSAAVSESEGTALRQAAPGHTRILQLGNYTAPQELLALIHSK